MYWPLYGCVLFVMDYWIGSCCSWGSSDYRHSNPISYTLLGTCISISWTRSHCRSVLQIWKIYVHLSSTFMTVLWFHPIKQCSPQSVEHLGSLVTSHEGGVITGHVLTPTVAATYACSVRFLVLYYNWNNLIWICINIFRC